MVVRSPCGTSEETSLNLQPRGHAHPASTGSLCAALSSALGITAGRARPPCFSVPKSACGKGGHPWGPRASDPTAGGGETPRASDPAGGGGGASLRPHWGGAGSQIPAEETPRTSDPRRGEGGARSQTPLGRPRVSDPTGGPRTSGPRWGDRREPGFTPRGGLWRPWTSDPVAGGGGRRPRISDPANAGEVGSHTPVWGPRASTLRGAVGTLDLRSRLGDAGNPRSLTTATGSGAWQYHSLQPANPGADSSGLERANPGGSL